MITTSERKMGEVFITKFKSLLELGVGGEVNFDTVVNWQFSLSNEMNRIMNWRFK